MLSDAACGAGRDHWICEKHEPHRYGAPLRLRVENQLGYKMVKWIERIEFVKTEKTLGKGEGGKNEDDEYFDILPNI